MKLLPLYTTVAISGASVLALEILGTRILGPFYGNSLFLWSALITVTLAALAVGYAVGGRWADKGATPRRLGMIVLIAGLWVLLIPILRRPLLTATEAMGLRTAVLLGSIGLFFLPLFLLGMVSPYAIRLRLTRVEDAGRTAGDLYAISTLASVAGALLTGFVLIPELGVSRLILLIGAALILAAGLCLTQAGASSRVMATILLLLAPATAAGGWKLAQEEINHDKGLTAIAESAYAQLRVIDKDDLRHFIIDGGVHTMVYPGEWSPMHRYAIAAETLTHLFPGRGRALIVGLGGGSLVKSYHAAGWDVSAVELDPLVTQFARDYFGLSESEGAVAHMDARRFLRTTRESWDLIIGDAYGSSAIPWQLLTREYFADLKTRLNDGGVVALNLECDGWDDILVRSTAATLRTSFSNLLVLPTSEPPNALGNVLLLASDRSLEIGETLQLFGHPKDFVPDTYRHFAIIQKLHAWDNAFLPDLSGVPIMTDDRTPVDLWAERINWVARKDLHDYFGKDGSSW
ncbi:MAG: fused MFS/spermidine synthase [Candidatus Eisenbacteria bacterium]|nr:fused MFS/spermidine synthase [Candidatus Eisenbacteria bacterium]